MSEQHEIITRAEAIAIGLKHYFTGKQCKRGGIAPRLVRNSDCTCPSCVDAMREIKRASHNRLRPPKGRFIHPNEESRKAAMNESRLRWRLKNPEKVKSYKRKWEETNYEKHREGASRRNKRYNAKTAGKRSEILKRWRKDSNGAAHAHTIARRARRVSATPEWDNELTEFVTRKAAELCVLREKTTKIKWHVDHMIPLQARNACGLHVWNNLQVIPAKMNVEKNNKMILMGKGEWLKNL